jgi:hypothetical protein
VVRDPGAARSTATASWERPEDTAARLILTTIDHDRLACAAGHCRAPLTARTHLITLLRGWSKERASVPQNACVERIRGDDVPSERVARRTEKPVHGKDSRSHVTTTNGFAETRRCDEAVFGERAEVPETCGLVATRLPVSPGRR